MKQKSPSRSIQIFTRLPGLHLHQYTSNCSNGSEKGLGGWKLAAHNYLECDCNQSIKTHVWVHSSIRINNALGPYFAHNLHLNIFKVCTVPTNSHCSICFWGIGTSYISKRSISMIDDSYLLQLMMANIFEIMLSSCRQEPDTLQPTNL